MEIRVELCDPKFSRKLLCDRVQISQVMINFLSNAFDAIESHQEKWVEINCEDDTYFDIITFTDSGHGIPPEVVEKMFNPFYTSKDVGKGTGLGLSISKGIMEKHGGEIMVDRTSKNTCFVLKIPKEESRAVA